MSCLRCGAPVIAGGVCPQCGTAAPYDGPGGRPWVEPEQRPNAPGSIPGMGTAPPFPGAPAYGGAPGAPVYGGAPAVPDSAFGYGTPYGSYPAFAAPQIPTPAALTPPGAVKEVLSKYATFQGRATRSEYWWWALSLWLALAVPWILASMVSAATGAVLENSPAAGFLGFYTLIVILGAALPSLAVAVRRMHDIGQSGALFLINLVPTIGAIVFLILCALPSKPFGNQYGLAPTRQH